MIDDENLQTGAFAGSSFSPSCSWTAVKMEGPESAEVAALSVTPPASGVHLIVRSYLPLIPVLSMMSRPSSLDNSCVNAAASSGRVTPLAENSEPARELCDAVPEPSVNSFRRLQYGTFLGHRERIDWKFSRFPMDGQLEAVGQELLKHRLCLESSRAVGERSQMIGYRSRPSSLLYRILSSPATWGHRGPGSQESHTLDIR